MQDGKTIQTAFTPHTRDAWEVLAREHPHDVHGDRPSFVEMSSSQQFGPLTLQRAQRHFDAGHRDTLVAVLNNLDSHGTNAAQVALAEAEAAGMLPSTYAQQQVQRVSQAIQNGNMDQADDLLKELTHHEPEYAEGWYHRGLLHNTNHRLDEAVTCFRKTLSLEPELIQARLLLAQALKQAGDHLQARRALAHYRCYVPAPEETDYTVLYRDDALNLEVIEDQMARLLRFNNQIQGGVFRDKHGALTPLPASLFLVSMLLAGAPYPNGKGLILGLGSGMGAVALLHAFPQLQLDVIDNQSAVIEAARNWFPVQPFEAEGRLRIIHDDAYTWVRRNQQPYDFAIIDIYTGDPEMPSEAIHPDFIRTLGGFTKQLWANLIAKEGQGYLERVIEAFALAERPLSFISAGASKRARLELSLNWIVGEGQIQQHPFPEAFAHLMEADGAKAHFDALWRFAQITPV